MNKKLIILNMGSVLIKKPLKTSIFIKHSPYRNTLHIAEYGELPISDTPKPFICCSPG
jgi:hypothetical protein